ncbi:hypothetical protein NST33_25005 [Paenibacillus sp. FSL L8-0435]|uniref:hypothetical protein n=1 Tax=Paenibacillus TaxID=44249 RepID=UPI001C8ED90E|nr:hypothetical protein [Paenibacillus xylanexedens]MBY0116509.1 hypothetical protein [Paenibacillus xylanexedens]
MKLTQEDFYCGAFLSYLLNNGIVPALFEDRAALNRKVYDFTTDKGDFRVYVKSSENPASKSDMKNSSIWNFPFTDAQIDELRTLYVTNKQLYFAFVCGQSELKNSKIAVIPADIALRCIDIHRERKYKTQSIKIKYVKGEWDFSVYGTARDDKSNGQDTSFKVRVKNIDKLFSRESA